MSPFTATIRPWGIARSELYLDIQFPTDFFQELFLEFRTVISKETSAWVAKASSQAWTLLRLPELGSAVLEPHLEKSLLLQKFN